MPRVDFLQSIIHQASQTAAAARAERGARLRAMMMHSEVHSAGRSSAGCLHAPPIGPAPSAQPGRQRSRASPLYNSSTGPKRKSVSLGNMPRTQAVAMFP
jgi:hypothetical protein